MEQQEIKSLTDAIKREMKLLSWRAKQEEGILMKKWSIIKSKCGHPNLPKITDEMQDMYRAGYGFSLVCPDCECSCGPENDGTSESDGYTPGKKLSQEDVIKMTKDVKEELQLLNIKYYTAENILRAKWDEIKLKCRHPDLHYNICQDCGWYPDGPLF